MRLNFQPKKIVMIEISSNYHCEKKRLLTLQQEKTNRMKYYYTLEYQENPAAGNRVLSADRDAVTSFLDGHAPDAILDAFVRQIGRMTSGGKDGWEICFVPGDSSEATVRRYSSLAESLRRRTGVDTRMNVLSWKSSRTSRFPEFSCSLDGKKNIILIDGLVDSGRTINAAAAALVGAGARSVTGLVAGKTVA